MKNDSFVGWKSFGTDVDVAVQDVRFTTKGHSILSEAVHSLSTVRAEFGAYVDDHNFLEPLGFGQPSEMYAVPLSARGRGVAVLYVDRDSDGRSLNVEALETLVRVAGLTVELLAAQSAKPQHAAEAVEKPEAKTETAPEYTPEVQPESVQVEEAEVQYPGYISEPTVAEPAAEKVETHEYEFETTSTVYETPETAPVSVEAESGTEPEQTYEFESNSASVDQPEAEIATAEPAVFEPVQPASEFEFTSNGNQEVPASVESEIPHVEFAAEEVSVVSNGNGYVHAPEPAALPVQPEPVVEAAPVQAAKPRLSERNVDLPIEVADEERKLHNDARRFARLLVSEIKLYNEQAVTAGRENGDLYDRLREAIDRSRDMYEKRVKPAVASKFDYFHYELVNGLAESDAKKLGGNYPGASV